MRTRRERMTMRTPNHWLVLCLVLLAYMIAGYYDSLAN
jgi:hypothetical protein